MSEWREISVEDISEKVCVGFVGTCGKYYCSPSEGVPMIRTTNLTERGISFDGVFYISKEFHDKNKKSQLHYGDILIARHGDNGKASMYLSSNEANCLNVIIVRIDKKKVNPKFFLYLFNSPLTRNTIQGMSSGSVQDVINTKQVAKLSLSYPERIEQDAIAEVLSSLDDKIDLLHRQNKTLEALAQTLFRQWFIEEAGDDWEECKLSDVLEIKYGKDHKKLADGKIPVYGSGGIMRYADSFLYDKESILIPRKGTLSNLFYIDEPFWSVDTLFWSKINTEKVSGKFLFSFLKTIDLSNLNVGSAVPSLTTKVLNEIKLSIPTIDEQKEFNEYADNAWEKMKSNSHKIKTLENMRDTLLPKLMGGEARIKYE